MAIVDVGNDFYHRLANRDNHQGDGLHNAIEFREKYLSELDNKNVWSSGREFITLDFINVKKIGPSFANAAFGHFMQHTDPSTFLKVVKFINITDVHLLIIKAELDSGYLGK